MSVAGGSSIKRSASAAGDQEGATKRKRAAAPGSAPNNARVINIDLPGNVAGISVLN